MKNTGRSLRHRLIDRDNKIIQVLKGSDCGGIHADSYVIKRDGTA